MYDRTYRFVRFALFLILAVGTFGCGRSALIDDISFDGGTDGPTDARPDGHDGGTCNATTCPSGCCDANGVCQTGNTFDACGAFGQACRDCASVGADFCDSSSHACGRTTPRCDFSTCSDGCCEGNICLNGFDPNECGVSGQACQHCAQNGLGCDANTRSCAVQGCGPQNCPGCCIGDTCQTGTDQTACGNQGRQCNNCRGFGEACTPTFPGGVCSGQTCDASNCNGCCDGNICRSGTDWFACGAKGQQCSACNGPNDQCIPLGGPGGGFCSQSNFCGPSNCKGCCQGDTCMNGTDNFACGVAGNFCQFCNQGQQCSNGFCQTTTTCGPQNCKGCCFGNTCFPGNDPNACGFFGQQCNFCGPSGTCPNGFCQFDGGTCGPQNCSGCCEGNTCFPGNDPNACGFGGFQCNFCGPNAACPNGSCQAAQCTPQNCGGCCDGNTCVNGDSSGACGFGGQQCMKCLPGAFCQGNVCQTTSTCGPQNCAGCCIGNSCFNGTDNFECGLFGKACFACPQGTTCISGACQSTQLCGPQNCAGCCQGNTCMAGLASNACGSGGFACQPCGPGQQCVPGGGIVDAGGPPPPPLDGGAFGGGFCQGTTQCGPQTCAGCCVNGVCAFGSQDSACGTGGSACQNCANLGETCNNGTCAAPACSPLNCAGCCAGNVCVVGSGNALCGAGGKACIDCTAFGDVCKGQTCTPPPPPCGPANCPGCCDAQGICEGGFLGSSCGSGGAACTSCTAQGSTCDTAVTPRVCKNQQQTCPAPYASCPSNVTTPVLPVMHVCSNNDLQQARAACGQANSVACKSFFSFESTVNPSCAKCLTPFDVPFNEGTGIFECTSPFVDSACNHDTGCLTDCETTSCAQCPAGTANQCRNDVQNNQCSQYVNNINCVFNALFGPASFCNPQNYSGFGAWLQGVGGHYCGP
jgi:hypothetical protein